MSTDERNLIILQAMDYFAGSLAGIFVTVFFFSNSDFKTTARFNFWMLVFLLFFYVLSGWTLKKISSALLIRISLVAGALFYLLMFILRGKSVIYIFPLAFLMGFSTGNYWAGYNLNQYILTNKETRVKYFGLVTGIINILQAIAPAIGGAIVLLGKSTSFMGNDAGYAWLFFIVFLINVLMIVFVGRLPSHEIPSFSYRHILDHKRSREWKLVLSQQALLGLYDVSSGVVIGILVYLIVKNEFLLGGSQFLGFLLGALGSIISVRLLKKKLFYWVGVLGLICGTVLFALWQNPIGVLTFVIITGFTAPFLNNWLSTVYFHALDNVKVSWREKYHFMLERDIALGVPRILSFLLLFIFLQMGNQVKLARISLYFLPLLPLGIGLLLRENKQ